MAAAEGEVEGVDSKWHFTVPHFITHPGQHLVLVGDAPELGRWVEAAGSAAYLLVKTVHFCPSMLSGLPILS